MQDNDLTQQAERYMQVWTAGGDSLLDSLAHSELKVAYTHFDRTYEGIEDYRAMLQMTDYFFPDLELTVEQSHPSGNKVTVQWHYSGTHQRGEIFGVEASGNSIRVQGISVLTFREGLVLQEEGVVDNLALLMQLGALNAG
jgi:predicted ester cyclase